MLVVLAMAAGVVSVSLARRSDRMEISALAGAAAGRARAARDAAVRSGRDAVLLIDLKDRTISTNGARVLPMPKDIDIDVFSSANERASATAIGIRFFPDGASTGGTIRLGHEGSFYEVRINWFTGRVLVVAPP